MKESKRVFIESLIKSNYKIDISNFLLYLLINSSPSFNYYTALVEQNINKSNKKIKKEDILDLYKFVYDKWYNYIKSLDKNECDEKSYGAIQFIKRNPKYAKENMTPENCQYFIFNTCENELRDSKIQFLRTQNEFDPVRYFTDDFIYIYPNLLPSKEKIECRLYLNLKPENVIPFIKKFLTESENQKVKTYLKFYTKPCARNDNVIIYTNYDDIQKQITIINQIKQENPYLFEGAIVGNPFLASINGFIGFGEEPKYQHSSFNYERANAMCQFVKALYEEETRKIGNFKGKIKNSVGQALNIHEYLKYVITTTFKKTLEKRQQEILKKQFPQNYTKEQIDEYIEIQNFIYNTCYKNLPENVEAQIDDLIKKIFNYMQKGSFIPREVKIPFQLRKTTQTNLSNKFDRKYILESGDANYYYLLDIDLRKKLFNVFGTESKIFNKITNENIKPFFEAHHVCFSLPFLNTETEAEFLDKNFVPRNK